MLAYGQTFEENIYFLIYTIFGLFSLCKKTSVEMTKDRFSKTVISWFISVVR